MNIFKKLFHKHEYEMGVYQHSGICECGFPMAVHDYAKALNDYSVACKKFTPTNALKWTCKICGKRNEKLESDFRIRKQLVTLGFNPNTKVK